MRTGVYQIRNTKNGKRYIGSAAGKGGFESRWRIHLHHLRHATHANAYLQNAWSKHGEDAFVFEVLETCEPYVCLDREQHYLDMEKPEYNINPSASSRLGVKLSDKTKAKISRAHKGKKVSTEEAARLRTLAYGIKRSQDHKEAIRQAQKGKPKSEQQRRKQSQVMTGKMSGEKHPNAKLTEQDVRQIKRLLLNDVKGVVIAQQFNVKPITISNIKTGRRWSHVGGV